MLLRAAVLLSLVASAPPRGAPYAATIARWRLRPDSFGPVRIDMTVAQASAALGRDLDPGPLGEDERECFYGRKLDEPVLEQLGFMFVDGRLTRIDVSERPYSSDAADAVQTREGARLGTTEAELRKLYPAATTEPHHYTDGHYIVVRTGARGLLFETDGERVIAFRAGEAGAIALVEGCN